MDHVIPNDLDDIYGAGAEDAEALVSIQEDEFEKWWTEEGYKLADEDTAFDIFVAAWNIAAKYPPNNGMHATPNRRS